MKAKWSVLLSLVLMTGTASAQTSASAQANASQDATASLSKDNGRPGVHASGNASSSADASAKAGKNSAGLSNGTTMQAELSHSLDARKNKPGDTVVAKTTQDVKSDRHVVIPKGSRLVGHVTEAKARAKGQSESSLGILFDHAVLKNGQEVPVHAVIQSLAASTSQASLASGGDDLFGSATGMGSAAGSGGVMIPAGGGNRPSGSGGGLLGGATSTAGSTVGAVANTAGSVGPVAGAAVGSTVDATASTVAGAAGTTVSGALSSTSSGVFGLNGLTLNSMASNASQGALIVSQTKNVHLDSGTRMLLRAEGQTQ
jgi:hypothetical protein